MAIAIRNSPAAMAAGWRARRSANPGGPGAAAVPGDRAASLSRPAVIPGSVLFLLASSASSRTYRHKGFVRNGKWHATFRALLLGRDRCAISIFY